MVMCPNYVFGESVGQVARVVDPQDTEEVECNLWHSAQNEIASSADTTNYGNT